MQKNRPELDAVSLAVRELDAAVDEEPRLDVLDELVVDATRTGSPCDDQRIRLLFNEQKRRNGEQRPIGREVQRRNDGIERQVRIRFHHFVGTRQEWRRLDVYGVEP